VHLRQRGSLRTDVRGSRWLPFDADQVIVPSVGFVWMARVWFTRFFRVDVRDALVNGAGSGQVSLMSALTIARHERVPEVTSGSLHRYLAEGVWCPSALYPSEALCWTAIDDSRALATLTDHGTSVSLEFRFAATGEVTGIYTPGRWGAFGQGYSKVAWEGHFRDYQRRAGCVIPLDADVGWYVDGAWQPVWRGRVIEYDLTAHPGRRRREDLPRMRPSYSLPASQRARIPSRD